MKSPGRKLFKLSFSCVCIVLFCFTYFHQNSTGASVKNQDYKRNPSSEEQYALSHPVIKAQSSPVNAANQVTIAISEGMVEIPAGCFLMGCVPGDRYCGDGEKPRREVCIERFLFDLYEVTNEKYTRCVKAGKCQPAHYTDGTCFFITDTGWKKGVVGEEFRKSPHPVVCIDWLQAKVYCDWAGKRLPTEAEWEYAARGGLDGKLYAWGDERPSASNRNLGNLSDESGNRKYKWSDSGTDVFAGYDDGFAATAPVGMFKANGYGLFDMTGNVWEWTADWYDSDYYRTSRRDNPKGPEAGTWRVLRGGSWHNDPRSVRVSFRNRNGPASRNDKYGFRCAGEASK